MQILSKYSLINYLNYLKVNRKNIHLYGSFVELLDIHFKEILIYDVSDTRNMVFRIVVGLDVYYFKQFSFGVKEKKNFFLIEKRQAEENKLPEVVFIDLEYQIIIYKDLTNYQNWEVLFRRSLGKAKERRRYLKVLAEYLKEIHRKSVDDTKLSVVFQDFEIIYGQEAIYKELPKFLCYIDNSTFIHGDIKKGNVFLQGSELRCIDWEMSGEGDLYFDLARAIKLIMLSISDNFIFERELTPSKSMIQLSIGDFIEFYDPTLNFEKLNLFMKFSNINLMKNDFYERNIDILLPKK